jgi:hypothetical protein
MASTPAASSTESKPAASSPSPSDSSLAAQMLGQPACGTFGCYGGQATCGVGQGCGQPRGWFGGGGLFAGPCNQYQQAATACTSGYGDACVTNNCGAPCNPWYAGVTALVVGRNCANRVWTTYETGNEPNQLMNTCDIGQKWRFGGEVRLGRRFCCDQWALEVSYWTADPFQGTHSMTNPAGVSTPLSTGFLAFAGDPVGNYFDGAAEHRLWRREEFHNVEVNLFRNQLWCDGYCPLSVDVLGGFRFFRFEESLTFATLQGGCVWGQNGGRNQAYLNDVVENNLWGAQIGFNCQYRLAQCFTLNIMPKFGLYDNHITNNFRLYRGDGVSAVSTHPGVPGGYPVRDVTDQVSFLTQIDIGCEWYFAPRWSLTAGYRVVAITGMALADHQITHYLVDLPEVSHTKTNGDLILHGAYLGVTYSF